MSIKHRKYDNYDEYLKHQARKLDIGIEKKIKKFMPEYFSKNVQSFEARIGKFKKYIKGDEVLCLGARGGAEVAAFRNLGSKDAIGIDINPGKDNKYVIKGDFHNMEFEDSRFDVIYCNSIDHAWDLRKLSKEIDRVMKDDSFLLLEIDHLINKDQADRDDWIDRDSKYESILCGNLKDIKDQFREFKFVKKFISANPSFLAVVFKKGE